MDAMEYEVHGFFEDLQLATPPYKWLGSRHVEEPDRPFGSAGEKVFEITENITLRRGHKQRQFNASPEKPLRVIGRLQILCGRRKNLQ